MKLWSYLDITVLSSPHGQVQGQRYSLCREVLKNTTKYHSLSTSSTTAVSEGQRLGSELAGVAKKIGRWIRWLKIFCSCPAKKKSRSTGGSGEVGNGAAQVLQNGTRADDVTKPLHLQRNYPAMEPQMSIALWIIFQQNPSWLYYWRMCLDWIVFKDLKCIF